MYVIKSSSISDAWREAVISAIKAPKREVIPLVVNIDCGLRRWPEEDLSFRQVLNGVLATANKASIETVARTIFPDGLWNPKKPRKALYKRFERILPKVRACRGNRAGHYFERLIRFRGSPDSEGTFNQLEHVIETYRERGNHRRSALQASLVNPYFDSKHSRRLGFPCLHQVSFLPDIRSNSMQVVAYYPTHYLFERAYGNYLGLLNLGRFMAKEMGFSLAGLTCVAGVAILEVSPNRLPFLAR